MHHSSDNPLGEGDYWNNDVEELLTSFDPASLTSEDDFTFVTHQVIFDYLKTHFYVSLHKDTQSAIHKAHSIHRTPVMTALC